MKFSEGTLTGIYAVEFDVNCHDVNVKETTSSGFREKCRVLRQSIGAARPTKVASPEGDSLFLISNAISCATMRARFVQLWAMCMFTCS